MFQFPSNGKDFLNIDNQNFSQAVALFQFPSNGKDFLNEGDIGYHAGNWEVFQFPSNGKDFLNCENTSHLLDTVTTVSIPFKREGLPQLNSERWNYTNNNNVSIPFKREGLSELPPLRTQSQ